MRIRKLNKKQRGKAKQLKFLAFSQTLVNMDADSEPPRMDLWRV